jgi:hypothetical protein
MPLRFHTLLAKTLYCNARGKIYSQKYTHFGRYLQGKDEHRKLRFLELPLFKVQEKGKDGCGCRLHLLNAVCPLTDI